MTTYSYAQLEGLWINAGGSKALAPTMAAIAEAESGGNSDAHNPSGASGLWQILGNPFPGNAFDPATNARMAVAKYKSQGLGAWVTYTSGAYKAYLSSKTSPDANVPGSPSAQTAAAVTSSQADCLLPNPLSVSLPLIGSITGGPVCLFSRSNARAFVGAALLLMGALSAGAGLLVIVAAAGARAGGPLAAEVSRVPVAGAYVKGAQGAVTSRARKAGARAGKGQPASAPE